MRTIPVPIPDRACDPDIARQAELDARRARGEWLMLTWAIDDAAGIEPAGGVTGIAALAVTFTDVIAAAWAEFTTSEHPTHRGSTFTAFIARIAVIAAEDEIQPAHDRTGPGHGWSL